MASSYSYTTQSNDSLPSVAEAFGHSGEWQTLWAENPQITDYNHIVPGWDLSIPADWVEPQVPPPSTSSSTKTGSSTGQSHPHSGSGAISSNN